MTTYFVSYTWYHGQRHGYGNVFHDQEGPLDEKAIEGMRALCEADLLKQRPDVEAAPQVIILFFRELLAAAERSARPAPR